MLNASQSLQTLDIYNLISKYVSKKKIDSALEPYAGWDASITVSLLINNTIRKATVYSKSQDVNSSFPERDHVPFVPKDKQNSIKITNSDPVEELSKLEDKFDAVICFPPFILKKIHFKFNNTELHDDEQYVALFLSLLRLNDNGEAIIVVPDNFLLRNSHVSVRQNLELNGFYINSAIKLYSTILPNTSIAPNILIISRKDYGNIYIAQYFRKMDFVEFVDNWINRKVSKSKAELGALVDTKDFTVVGSAINKLNLETKLRRYPFPKVLLHDLISESHLGIFSKGIDSFKETKNSVYLPVIGNSDVVTRLSDLKIKPQNYIQLVLNDKVIPEYLAGFFNSSVGREYRVDMKVASIIPRLNRIDVMNMAIPLPNDINLQKQLAATDKNINQMMVTLQDINYRLWEKPTDVKVIQYEFEKLKQGDDYNYFIKQLPFPIASILKKYLVEDNIDNKNDYILYFFEAVTEFLNIILLSAFFNNPSSRTYLKDILSNDLDKQAIQLIQFGSMTKLALKLTKLVRTFLSGGDEEKQLVLDMFKVNDYQIIEALTNKDLYILLDNLSVKRNGWSGHTAPISLDQKQLRHEELKTYLDQSLEFLIKAFRNVLLIKPIQMVYNHGTFTTKCLVLSDSDTNFQKQDIVLLNALDADYLHVFQQDHPDALELLPFIKLMPSPKTALNSCYFFNRISGDNYRWLSYHYEKESEVFQADAQLDKAFEQLIGEDVHQLKS